MSTLRRRIMGAIKTEEDYSMYAVHKKVNPAVMAICYAQGWAANENYMTFEEAAAVTSIGTIFAVNTITSFDEFQYFTGVTAIPNNAFNKSGSKLASIKLPPNIVSIGTLAFRYTLLTEFTITPSITSIGNNAFQDINSSYIDITLDNNNLMASYNGFLINAPTRNFYVGENCTNVAVYDNCYYSTDYKTLYAASKLRDNVSFHPNCTNIGGSYACRYVDITSLVIPSNITSIGMQAFANCKSLLSVNLGNAQIQILNNTFIGCSNLTGSVDLSNVRALNGTPFRYSKLVLIDCGSQISALGQIVQDCNYVTTLIVRRTTPPTLHTISATRLSSNNALVYVPDANVEDYKAANVWSTIADIIKPLSEYQSGGVNT